MILDSHSDYYRGVLSELIALPKETEWVEFKHNNSNPKEIGEYISALSNSATLCGKTNAYLIWGISDKDNAIVGTTFKPKQERIGNEELENWLLQHLNPKIHFQLIEIYVSDMLISIIEIPQATHTPTQFQGVDYIRVGSYKKKLKDFQEKERLLWRSFEKTPFEIQIAATSLNDSDVLKLIDYPSYFQLLDIPLPENRDNILSRLAKDHMIEQLENKKWNILNQGAMLFAFDLSNFRHLSRKALRVVIYEGNARVQTKREYPGSKGYAVAFEGVIGFLKDILPEYEVTGDPIRKTVPMYPEIAIRELVANVMIHQDFTMTGAGPMVEIFQDRIEITNPGQPLVDVQRFLDTPPQSRNEALASFLRRIGICEERGSGVDKVVFQTELFQLPAPLFEVVGGQTRVVLFAHKAFAEMDKADRIRACYLHSCLQHVQRKQLTNSSLRVRFGIEKKNAAQVSRVIKDTLDAGVIRNYNSSSESKRHACYIPFWA
ncbi:MAG: ATP-binding protein [Candidatus Kariarchaeaceae archaeon]